MKAPESQQQSDFRGGPGPSAGFQGHFEGFQKRGWFEPFMGAKGDRS